MSMHCMSNLSNFKQDIQYADKLDSLLTRMLETLRSTCSNLWGIAGSTFGLLADPHAEDSMQYTCSNLWGIAGRCTGILADPTAENSVQYTCSYL
jgi:hypothetical protein